MIRSPKQPSPRNGSHQKPVSAVTSPQHDKTAPSVTTALNDPLQMQATLGNQATQRRLIQRMPTVATIKTILGEPKKDKKIGIGRASFVKANSTKYQYVLNVVQFYEDHLNNNSLATTPNAITKQFKDALDLLDNITTTAGNYDNETGMKAGYMKHTLKPEVLKEKTNVATTLASILHNPTMQHAYKDFKLGLVIKKASTIHLSDNNIVGRDRGGASEVTKFGGNNPGYFKETKNKLANWEEGGKQAYLDNATQDIQDPNEQFAAQNALGVEKDLAVDLVGIDPNDARMANRDVATSRLNQLLGANVIAKAEMAVRHTGGGDKQGSLMADAGASGKSAFNMAEQGDTYDPAAGDAKGAQNQMSLQDPELMRQLSRLQLIDSLAFQVDRNTKNYYIQVDANGNVMGVTGIDNDLSMGTNDENDKRQMELPGFSRYVDEELAIAILNLDVEILQPLMADLLSEAEIAALLSRLKKLQAFLKPLYDNGSLLKPNQWTAAIAQNLLDEKASPKSFAKKNYYSQFVDKVTGESQK